MKSEILRYSSIEFYGLIERVCLDGVRISSTDAARELKLSLSQLFKLSEELSIKPIQKGARVRHQFNQIELNKISSFINLIEKGIERKKALDLSISLGEYFSSIYNEKYKGDFEYQLEVNYIEGDSVLETKIKRIVDSIKMMDDFKAGLGFYERLSLLSNYLEEEIKNESVKLMVTPFYKKTNELLLFEDLKKEGLL